ncbi:embryonic polyadenylate-binding protein 2-B-like [Hylaeus volcanicus]|uniref:embryonic polyadenylate-binding protein 2-B-like n=1 Tax=Hylaeus volcanicus TaxID=313075 RepID=UPI0023B858A7|nr:embryonic polyadenylate-binding protein 2-B-like [Hylaeus volcanicus]
MSDHGNTQAVQNLIGQEMKSPMIQTAPSSETLTLPLTQEEKNVILNGNNTMHVFNLSHEEMPEMIQETGDTHLGDGMEEQHLDEERVLDGQDCSFRSSDDVDSRSIFVGNIDYAATPLELREHFKLCGYINRITLMVDRYTGHPKGYAYIEFQNESAISTAVMLSDSIFRDRPLKVSAKRKNIPGYKNFMMSGRGAPFGMSMPRGKFGRGMVPPQSFRGRRGYVLNKSSPLNSTLFYSRMHGIPGYFPRYRGRGQRSYGPY